MRHLLRLVFTVTCAAGVASAQHVPTVNPEDVGMSSERLGRIDDFVERHIAADHFAGAVTLVARRGRITHFKAYGMQDLEARVPMATNSIFRFYSMTKPITSVAVMMLFEEGRFLLTDPVSKYLPELKDLEVGVEEVDGETEERILTAVPADREVTIRDLLRHTSGLAYGFWGDSLVDTLYLEKGVLSKDRTIQDTVQKLATIPLKYQPGSMWEYSVSTDVLGRLVEVVSGQPFDEYLRSRIFEPLGMTDTGFYVPPEETHRLATVYTPNEDNTAITPFDPEKARDFTKPTAYFSGGGGLVSTASDYYRFAQMLLGGGEFDGVRILGPETIELMTEDHLDGIPMRDPGGTYGFGLGFGISPDRGASGSIVSGGSFWWGGMAHTGFWVDPEEELIGIFLTQILPESPMSYRDLFAPVVYQAVID